ncbi:LysR family transcriptional regulator [Novosphingobium sp.]|uniref:LysR family transcriptional regulator n=1 Tax=Novosphingobium sp. TaxID=1874826 RepID=UPI002630DFCA|nr:LysR family transcriptional regulator [Novosphingobium sp.]
MRFRGLDLNLLVALDVLLEERNVTRAAERMHVGQSAMSAALARLRQHFEDDLLVASGRQMVPSALAATLQKPVKDVILQIGSLVETERQFIPARSTRQFTVEMPDHLQLVVLPMLMRQLSAEAPGVMIDVRPPSRDPSPSLATGELDLVLTPGIYADPEYACEVLATNQLVVLGCKDNTCLQEQPDLATVLSLRQVIVPFDRHRLGLLLDEQQMALYSGRNRTALIAPNFGCIPACLVKTQHIAILNRRLAEASLRSFALVMWEVPLAMPTLDDIIMYHPLRQNDGGHLWLRNQLKKAILVGSTNSAVTNAPRGP